MQRYKTFNTRNGPVTIPDNSKEIDMTINYIGRKATHKNPSAKQHMGVGQITDGPNSTGLHKVTWTLVDGKPWSTWHLITSLDLVPELPFFYNGTKVPVTVGDLVRFSFGTIGIVTFIGDYYVRTWAMTGGIITRFHETTADKFALYKQPVAIKKTDLKNYGGKGVFIIGDKGEQKNFVIAPDINAELSYTIIQDAPKLNSLTNLRVQTWS